MKKIFVYGGLMAKHKDKQTAFPAYLDGYKVSFDVIGINIFEPSFATLVAQTNNKAYGIVISLSDAHFKKYISHEVSYHVKNVDAIDLHGTKHACVALFLKKPGYTTEVMPSARYAHQLYKGARYHGLPKNVCDYYLDLKKRGNKLTYFLRFLFPLYLKCIPHIGRHIAFYIIIVLLPISFLITITLLSIKLI